MGREPAQPRVALAAGEPLLELRLLIELLEEARHRARLVAGPGQIADAELIRLELLLARVAGDVGLCAEAGGLLRELPRHLAAEDRGSDRAERRQPGRRRSPGSGAAPHGAR